MILPVGKPTIYIAKCDEDGNLEPWVQIDTPKEGTTSMETAEGDKTEYIEEGGGLVDSYQKTAKYTLSFELFPKKNVTKPIEDRNGVILDNYAIKVIPEDHTCYAFILWRCSVSCVETYNVTDGLMWKYTFSGLVSPDHTEIMDYFKESESLSLDKNYIVLSKAGGSGKVTAKISAGDSVSVDDEGVDWVSAEKDGGEITFTAEANSGEKRSGFVKIKTDGKSADFKVIQESGI